MTRDTSSKLGFGAMLLLATLAPSLPGCGSCEEAGEPQTDAASDVGDTDAGRVTTAQIQGEVVLPRGEEPSGWVLLNRLGRWDVDSAGRVDFEAAEVGLTLSVLIPPGAEDKAGALLFATMNLPERAPVTTQRLDVAACARALLWLDPRTSSLDDAALDALGASSYGAEVDALAATLEARFDPTRALTADPEVLGALDRAADAVLRSVAPLGPAPTAAWPDDDLGPGLELVRPLGALTRLVEVRPRDGALDVAPLPLAPAALVVTAHRVDVDAMPTPSPDTLLAGTLAETGPEVDLTAPLPTDAVIALTARLDSGPHGEAILAAELMARWSARASACDDARPEGFDATVASLLTCPGMTEPEREAGRRIAGLGRSVAQRTLARHRATPLRLGLDPAGAWAPFGSPVEERFYIVSGHPFDPRPTLIDPRETWFPGDAPALSGPLSAHPSTRLVVVDAAHRTAPLEGGTLPPGLAGPLTLHVVADGGSADLPLGPSTSEVLRLDPAVLTAPGPVRIEGRGLYAGQPLTLGGATVTLPDDTTDRVAVVALDPALVGRGSHALGQATLVVADALTILDAPTSIHAGESLMVTLFGARADEPLAATSGAESLPVLLVSPGRGPGRVVAQFDTRRLSAGDHTLTLHAGSRSATLPLTITGPPTLARDIAFHAPTDAARSVELGRALAIANGTLIVSGRFQRVDMGFKLGNIWHCPLDISPDEAAIPPASCASTYVRCDEGWLWDTVANPDRWLTVTRPPGRGSTGVRCPVIPGPDTWEGLAPADVWDTVTTADPVGLGGQVLSGPGASLVLPDARGGGLAIRPVGARNDVVLDLDVTDALSTEAFPVVHLDGAVGVRGRIAIRARPGSCRVGLRIEDARDIELEVRVEGCERAVEVVGSTDVRLGRPDAPAVLVNADDALKIETSEAVVAFVRIGSELSLGAPEAPLRKPVSRGVTIAESSRIGLSGELGAVLEDAVNVSQSTGVVLATLAVGWASTASGGTVREGFGVGRGFVIDGGEAVVRDATVLGADDGLVVDGGAEVEVSRLVFAADGTNANSDIRLISGSIRGEDLVLGRGLIATGGRLDLTGLRGKGGPCFADIEAVETAHLADFDISGTGPLLCVGGGDLELVNLALSTPDAVALEAKGVANLELADIETTGQILLADTRAHLARVSASGVTAEARDSHTSVSFDECTFSGDAIFTADEYDKLSLFTTNSNFTHLTTRATVMLEGGRVDSLTAEGGRLISDAALGAVVLTDTTATLSVQPTTLTLKGQSHLALEAASATTVAELHLEDLNGHALIRGGRWRLEATESEGLELADATLEGLDAQGLRRARIHRTEIVGTTSIDDGRDLELEGLPSATLTNMTRAAIIRPQREAVVTLEGHPQAVAFHGSVGPAPAPGLPTGDIEVTPAITLVRGVPDHALVRIARRNGGVSAPLAVAYARRGVARFPNLASDGSLVASVTVDGLTGPWIDAPVATTCTAPSAPPGDEAAAADLLVHYDDTLPAGLLALARCGDIDATLARDNQVILRLGDTELMRADDIDDLAFSPDCTRLAWVATAVAGELDARPDVYLAEGAVVTRLTRDDAREEQPYPTRADAPQDAVWFARSADDEPLALAHVDLENGALIVDLALGLDLTAPRPAPDSARVAFLACGDTCRLAALDQATGAWSMLGVDDGCEVRSPWWVEAAAPYLVLLRGAPGEALSPVSATASGLIRGRL